jgi:3-oxoacyl-[acyl-carrier-protein] synthase II
MTNLRESLQRVPVNLRYALLTELQALDGYQNADLSALTNENELLAALASAVNGIAQRKRRRVVITGIGAVTPLANNAAETWQALVAGKSGITAVTQFDASLYASQVGGELKNFDPTTRIPHKEARRMARCSQVAVVAAHEAVEDAQLDWSQTDLTRAGIVMGTGIGGLDIYRDLIAKSLRTGDQKIKATPMEAINGLPNMPAYHISQAFGCRGPLSTVVTACAAGTQAIGAATEEIRRGAADVMLAGGVEAMITDLFYAAFTAMRAVTTQNDEPQRASRPFDANRDGFVIGEGSAVFVLESLEHALARGARIYAEVLGWSESADAYHIAQPDPEGRGAALAMRAALADASLDPAEIGYINAHAAGTPLGDAHETKAIKDVFGPRAYEIPVSSTKSMIGHLFGGAGAVEAMACVYSVYTDTIHPTVNYENPDPECDLDYVPNVSRQTAVNVALSNSFGLGGQNACLIVGKYRP